MSRGRPRPFDAGARGRRRWVVPLLALLPLRHVAPFAPPAAAADDASVPARFERFRATTRSGSFAERLLALERLVDVVELRTVDAVLWAGLVFRDENASHGVQIAKDEALDRATAADIERVERVYEKLGSVSATQYERRMKERARLDQRRRELALSIEASRTAIGRLGRLLDRTRDALTRTFLRLPADACLDALDRARASWLRGPSAGYEDKRRYLDAIAWVRRPGFDEAISSRIGDPLEDVRIRGAALTLRAERRGDGVFGQAVALLPAPSWVLEASAIEALRLLHDIGCIDPLIGYLGRDDLGRLREDARRALCSLTGEAHGPYREPWQRWWNEARPDFEMPRSPMPVAPPGGVDAGAAFYGITTFSRHVLFVLDVSSSMAAPAAATPAAGTRSGESKFDIARREFAAALGTLDDGGTFGVLLFHDDVTEMPGGVVRTEANSRARARTFVTSVEPTGATNVIDALERALAMAGASGNAPKAAIDTIFFLTDGRPSAGASVDPAVILDAVARHRRALPFVIHAVGVGDHDPDFLRRLAESTGGRYVTR